MPKELHEIKNFMTGTITTPSETDIPDDSASYSLNIDPVAEDGILKGIPDDLTLTAGGFVSAAQPEITTVECTADVSDSLAGKYFLIYGATGKTLVWLDVDNDNTPSKPTGLSEDLVLEVQGIATNDPVEKVAIEIANTVGDHAEFLTEVQGDTVIITDAASASRTDAFDGDTGFTITTDKQGGASSVPATFQINDISIVYRTKSIK